MEEKTVFGRFVAAKRREENLTQGELARRLYVTESAVSKWERGVSYPDITLVSPLCSALGISEHELITASEDVHQRQIERQAGVYRRLKNTYILTFYIIYGVTLLICFICNLAYNHALTWFFIVTAACLTAFSLTSLPLVVQKKKGLITLGSFFLSLNLLLLVCCVYTSGRWFFVSFASLAFAFSVVFAPSVLRKVVLPAGFGEHKALLSLGADTLLLFLLLTAACLYQNRMSHLFYPVGAVALCQLALPWAFLVVIRYLKLSVWFRASVSFAVGGLYILTVNSVLNVLIDRKLFELLSTDLGDWNGRFMNGNLIAAITLACFASAILFSCKGTAALIGKHSLDMKRGGHNEGRH